MTIDVAAARRDTPGVERVIHFNNCGAALMPRPVIAAVDTHLRLESEIGGYEAEARAADALEGAYGAVARLIGAGADEIALVENATRAWDMAFYAFDFRPGDRILTAMAEYASNYIAFLQVARRTGAVVEPVPDDADGQLDVEALARMIDDRVRLIAVTHVPTNGGLVNPAAAIGRVARAAGVPFLLDACQSVGQMPVDVEAIGCDMLSATGRKFLRGPRGTGFLYVRRPWIERLEPPFLDLRAATWTTPERYEIRADARRFETWESFVAGRLGLAAAADYATGLGLDAIWARVRELADTLRARLATLPGARVRDLGRTRCGIVTFTIDGRDPEEIKTTLGRAGINATTSSAASTRLDMTRRRLDKVVRLGVHYYNTETEIDRLVAALGG